MTLDLNVAGLLQSGMGGWMTGDHVNLVLHTKPTQRSIPTILVLRPGERAQLTKCSPCKHEDLSFNPEHFVKAEGGAWNPNTREIEA